MRPVSLLLFALLPCLAFGQVEEGIFGFAEMQTLAPPLEQPEAKPFESLPYPPEEYESLDWEETNYSKEPRGPSSRGCCKVINGNSCGSGSLVGVRNGKSLVLTNAHVAGTRIGRVVRCTFPFANNRTVNARVILAAYSDRIMMDWAVLEVDEKIDLPHTKLSIEAPMGKHYTMGYPRCRGPYSQELETRRFLYNGTVWRWQPNSIGGQSGSAVHSYDTNLQRGLLTWSWGGDGAGQTTKSIWTQYSQRAAIGYLRPKGLQELSTLAEGLEEGFFVQTNITSLPIWAHLDDDEDDPSPPGENEFAAKVLQKIGLAEQRLASVMESHKSLESLAKQYLNKAGNDGGGSGGDTDKGGDDSKADPTFGL